MKSRRVGRGVQETREPRLQENLVRSFKPLIWNQSLAVAERFSDQTAVFDGDSLHFSNGR